MARYLLESGAPDGYLLEDGSGVLLLEGLEVSPAPVAVTLAVPAPTIETTGGAVNLTPDPVPAPLTVPAPAIGTELTLTPAPVAVTLTVPLPNAATVTSITPDPVAVLTAVPSPSLVVEAPEVPPGPGQPNIEGEATITGSDRATGNTTPGFHQLVLSNSIASTAASVGPPITMQWSGTGGGMQIPSPAIIQDTDGFSGTPGDMQDRPIRTWTVPAGCAGTYKIGAETLNTGGWWTNPAGPDQVPYPFAEGDQVGCGAEIADDGAGIRFEFRVNDVVRAYTAVTKSVFGYWAPGFHIAPVLVDLAEGDVCETTFVFTGTHFFNAMAADYGLLVVWASQAIFAMTMVAAASSSRALLRASAAYETGS